MIDGFTRQRPIVRYHPHLIHQLCIALALVAVPHAASGSTIGGGAPSESATSSFINAYYRGSFAPLVNAVPPADVQTFGPTGLIQEFQGRINKSSIYALVKPDATAPVATLDTLQVFPDIYPVYAQAGVGNAGYPTGDASVCPDNAFGTCNYQLFTKNYAIFAYSSPIVLSVTIKEPYYSEWAAQGAVGGNLGVPTDSVRAVTSPSKVTGNQLSFLNGQIYSYSSSVSGVTTISTFSVFKATYAAFSAAGGLGVLGLPTSGEVVLTSGLHRQTFEYARVESSPANPPQVLFPIGEIDIVNSVSGLAMHLGDVVTLSAATFDTRGAQVSGRAISWTTTNGQAISIQSNGYTATVKAIASGVANVAVTSEGKTSPVLLVRVDSPCCGVGEGAPSAAVSKAFQDAVARNRLNVVLPNPTSVVRTAGGYTQSFSLTPGGTATISQSDKSTVAYALTGAPATFYIANGGFGGVLGYPASDASVGGTQLFESGAALAGVPIRVVPAAIRHKWSTVGYENGILGAPTADAANYVSAFGASGVGQSFSGGAIYSNGANSAFFSSGPILAQYVTLNGLTGPLGAPVGDISTNGSVTRQNFENGYIDYQAGAASAVPHLNARKPAVSALPGRVAPGGRVRLSVSGFALGTKVVVSQTGQPDFQVTVPAGGYSWDIVVPANAAPNTFSVVARDANGTDTANTSYSLVTLPQLAPSFTVISGDLQTGAPGSLLPLPVVAVLKDIAGNPIAGIPVFGSASPGASIQVGSVTDSNGLAYGTVRLSYNGVAIVSMTSGGKVASFSALSAASSIVGFPILSQQDSETTVGGGNSTLLQKGSLVTSLAGVLRYYQNHGALGAPNGLATPQLLNQYLTTNGGYVASETKDLIASPWSATAFAGLRGGVAVESPTLERLYDLIAIGAPVVIGLSVNVAGSPAGMTYVVAIGVAADGGVHIADSAFGRSSLSDYLYGFSSAGGKSYLGTVGSLLRVNPALQVPNGFVVGSTVRAAVAITGAGGSCDPALTMSDGAIPDTLPFGAIGGVRFVSCDGTQAAYQAVLAAPDQAAALDFTGTGTQNLNNATARIFGVSRVSGILTFTPQTSAIVSVVDSASFRPGLTAGGLATIFGSGLAAGASDVSTVTVAGIPAYVYASFPFQVNFQIPPGVPVGNAFISLSGTLGTATFGTTIVASAPGVFAIGRNKANQLQGAVVNQDGSVNGPNTPAMRGTYIAIYCTGLGAKALQDGYLVAQTSVKVVLDGNELVPLYAGVAPGLIGVDQVNVQVPTGMAPSSASTLLLRRAGVDSVAVVASIQ